MPTARLPTPTRHARHPPAAPPASPPCLPPPLLRHPACRLQLVQDWRAFRARLVAMESGQTARAASMQVRHSCTSGRPAMPGLSGAGRCTPVSLLRFTCCAFTATNHSAANRLPSACSWGGRSGGRTCWRSRSAAACWWRGRARGWACSRTRVRAEGRRLQGCMALLRDPWRGLHLHAGMAVHRLTNGFALAAPAQPPPLLLLHPRLQSSCCWSMTMQRAAAAW